MAENTIPNPNTKGRAASVDVKQYVYLLTVSLSYYDTE